MLYQNDGSEQKMTAAEFLSQACLMEKAIEAKSEQIMRLDAMTKRITANWKQEAVSRTRDVTSREAIIARMLDKEKELEEDIRRMLRVQDEIEQMIARVRNPKIRLILEKRYLGNISWVEIGDDLGHDERWVKTLAQRGVREIQTLLDRQHLSGQDTQDAGNRDHA